MNKTCKKTERILLSAGLEELQPDELKLIMMHLNECPACKKIYESISEAEKVIKKLASSVPVTISEEALTESIMNRIRKFPQHPEEKIFNNLIAAVSGRAVRFALGATLFFAALSFIYPEYSDTKKIVLLEERMNGDWNNNFNYSSVLKQEEKVLHFFYKLYRLARGRSSYLEITDEIVLMNKSDLKALFEDYDKFDDQTKMRLEELKNSLLEGRVPEGLSGYEKSEVERLRREVERLNEELIKKKSLRGIK